MNVGMQVAEPARRLPVADELDVLVCGAGPAGVAAALAAARTGARTGLIESNGCLGGVWTAGLLAWMFEMDQPGIPQEITHRLAIRGARTGRASGEYNYDVEEMKLLLEEMCCEAGVRFQLHTRAVGVVKQGRCVSHAVTESKSGRQAWAARCFVDASGDGDLAALAGCGFDVGREGSGECQPMTYMALVSVRDATAVSRCISFWDGELRNHLQAVGHFQGELNRAGMDSSYGRPTLFQVRGNLLALMINHEYGMSATDAEQITRASVRGRAEVHCAVKALRGLGGVWEEMRVVATCEHIGVREGRRIHGLYTVSQDDLAVGRRHADAVCRVSFSADVHCTNASVDRGQESIPFCTKPYDIPVRALIARDVSNLMLAGRCLSGDFLAHSSYRVTGTAAASGQAAGVAAALSARTGKIPAEQEWSTIRDALDALT